MLPPPSAILFAAVAVLLLVGSPALLRPPSASAEEIVATDEWKRLGENDTVPAGLHVRIDMTTGEKWVKTVVDDEKSDFDRNRDAVAVAVEVDADGTANASGGGSGSASSAGVAVSAASGGGASEEEEDAAEVEPEAEYDYLMMHRTLKQLPDDEKERMGGFPELPPGMGADGSAAGVPPERREQFESRMREIWTQRQELLRRVQDELVADLPMVLQERIAVVRSYLEDPAERRRELLLARGGGEGSAVTEAPGDDLDSPGAVRDIVHALEDLEYHLSDVDMARDFHTLGGWPLVVSLLSDSVHFPASDAEAAGNETSEVPAATEEETRALVDEIQSLAAWVVGTAVKNHEEFHPWALEDFSSLTIGGSGDPARPSPWTPATAVSLLVSNFRDGLGGDGGAAPSPPSLRSKRQKGLYALGALVRGNPRARAHFLEAGGPEVLGADAARSLGAAETDRRFASKVLALGCDLLTDVALHPASAAGDANVDAETVRSLTAPPWCEASVELAGPASGAQVREKALEAMRAMAPGCGFGEGARDVVRRARAEWVGSSGGDGGGLDPAYRNELIGLADSVITALDAEGSSKE